MKTEIMSPPHLFRLKVIYGIAFAFIAATFLFSSLVMQHHLESDVGDSRVVNLSGRQRMLSQRLTKCLLVIELDPAAAAAEGRLREIETSLKDWIAAHEGLQHGDPVLGLPTRNNSGEIRQLFQEIESPYRAMVQAVMDVQRKLGEKAGLRWQGNHELKRAAATMLTNEPHFLKLMDQITFQFDREANARIENLKTLEMVLLAIGLLVLLLEFLIVFRPSLGQLSTMLLALEQRGNELTKANSLMADAIKQVRQANRAKSEFLANISHELNTPLNSIIGFSQVLLEKNLGGLDERQQRYVENILNSGERLHTDLENIVSFVRMDVSNPDMDWGDFRLKDIVDSSLSIFRKAATDRHLTIALDMEKKADRMIRADMGKLAQVFHNLLSNAVKFSKAGGSIALRVRYRENPDTSGKNDFIEVTVEDTGVGIKEEDLPRLFQPFEQLDAPLTKQFNGVGMGLVLSRKIIEAHGGTIYVESDYGKGSRFIFTIPLKDRYNK